MRKNHVLLAAAMIAALPLAAFAYLGLFTRYLADDFCTVQIAREQGISGLVTHWYATWSGRFTNWIIKGWIDVTNPGLANILPILMIVIWLAAAIWMFYQIVVLLRVQRPVWIALFLGTLWLYALLVGAAEIIQTLYWVSGSIPYLIPLIALTFYIGFFLYILRRCSDGKIPLWAFFITAAIAFVAGGLSEMYAIFQGVIFGLMILGIFIAAPNEIKRSSITLLLIALVGSAVAFMIVLSAPGNEVRKAAFGETLAVAEIVLRTLRVAASFFATDIGIFSPIPLLVALILPAVVTSQFLTFDQPIRMSGKRARKLLASSGGVAILLLLVVIGPSIYGTSVAPTPRVYFTAHLVMISTAMFWGCVVGLDLKRTVRTSENRPAWGAVMVLGLLLIVGPLAATIQILNRTPAFNSFASEWDQRDYHIRTVAANGEQNITVRPLSVDLGQLAGLDIIDTDPNGWVNQCAAQYYQVESIALRES
jgi:hypothetical protein